MKQALIFLLSVILFISTDAALKTDKQLKAAVSLTDAQAGDHLRHFSAWWFPDINPRMIGLVGVDIERTGENSASGDAVLFALNTLLETALAFGYYHAEGEVPLNNANITANVQASGFAFALRFFQVFEWEDTNGTPGFQLGVDTVISTYDLSSLFLSWKPMIIDISNMTDASGNPTSIFIVTIETTDEVFYLRFTATGHPADVGSVRITPDSVKVDIRIRWFNNVYFTGPVVGVSAGPSTVGAHPNAQVGLTTAMGALAAAVNIHQGDVSNNPSVEFTDNQYFTGFLSWEPTADITVGGVEAAHAVAGTVVPVTDPTVSATFAAGWLLRLVAFTFNAIRPTEVAWDPEVGANIDYAGLNSALSLHPTILVAFMIVFALFFMRK